MIDEVVIQNFRCLRDVRVPLTPLTVLVGANGSGKTSVLDAVLRRHRENDYWRKDAKLTIRVELRNGGNLVASSVKSSGNWKASGQQPVAQVLQLDLQQLRSANQLAEVRTIDASGFGLTNLFATLTRPKQDALAKEFCRLVPMYADVAAKPLAGGHHRLVFEDRWQPGVWYEPQEVSDGSMLLFAFLALQHEDPAPDLIGIEEPERGLHPFLLNELLVMLRRLTNGGLGRKQIQVLLATHSADLLEFVKPEEVRFLSRSAENGDVVIEQAPTTAPEWPKAVREYQGSLGKMWLSGGLGGVPGN